MSKIFETLNRGGGNIADLIRPLVSGPDAATPPADEEKPADRLRPEQGTPGERPATAASELMPPGARTLSLRVPAPSPLLPFEGGRLAASEQYRILRTKITQDRRQPRLIVISSPDSGDGKSVNATNLAAALSLKDEAQTLLLDADLRRSSAHLQLGLPDAPGLAEVLQGKSTLEEALVRTREFPNLYVLTAGKAPPNPAELLDSPNWPALCARLRKAFRFVIADSPPVAAVADYDLIQAACDAVILVARPDRTDRELLRRALETVPKEKFLGVLLNCVPKFSFARYYSPSDYYYRHSGDGTAASRTTE